MNYRSFLTELTIVWLVCENLGVADQFRLTKKASQDARLFQNALIIILTFRI